MKRLAAGAALLVSSTAGAVSLPQVPELGSSLAGLDTGSYQCRAVDRLTECRRGAIAAERIAEVPVSQIVLFYRDARLVRSVFVFDEARFDALVGRLAQLLGSAVAGNEALKAGMAGVFDNRYYTWRKDRRVWFVEQFFERITDSGVWLMEEAEFARL